MDFAIFYNYLTFTIKRREFAPAVNPVVLLNIDTIFKLRPFVGYEIADP